VKSSFETGLVENLLAGRYVFGYRNPNADRDKAQVCDNFHFSLPQAK